MYTLCFENIIYIISRGKNMPEKCLRILYKIEPLYLSITTMETSYKRNLIICLTVFKISANDPIKHINILE